VNFLEAEMSAQGDEDVSLWDRVKGYFDKER